MRPVHNPAMSEPDSLQLVGQNEVRLRGRKLLYFSGCDYFRLARHPAVAQAMVASLAKNGLSVAASRRTTGNHTLYERLEAALAGFFGVESALLLPDGYFGPLAVAQALAGEPTDVFIDEFAHGALRDAARMFDWVATPFQHRNPADLARQFAWRTRGGGFRPIVLTDGMFGHDGSVAPLREYLELLPAGGRLLVDDAHGVGILGATGRGSLEHAGVPSQLARRVVLCATLSKAFGTYGGVVLGSHALRRKMLAGSRLFAGTTPLPLPLAGAALEALKIMRLEPGRRRRLHKNAGHVRSRLRAAGWDIPEQPGPIVRLPPLDERRTRALKARFLAAGIYPPYFKYGQTSARGFFRLVIASEHTVSQLDQLVAVLAGFKT
jgi:7-keto-8-aminopelargonate synthetase-like enzyme